MESANNPLVDAIAGALIQSKSTIKLVMNNSMIQILQIYKHKTIMP